MSRNSPAVNFCLYLAALLFLSACSRVSEEQTLMQTYANRVAYVLDEPPQWNTEQLTIPALPAQRQRFQKATDISEGLLDVLDLGRCDLLSLIASRNSSLGKLAAPSQRLSYEIQFYVKIRQCLTLAVNDPTIEVDLKKRIEKIVTIKRDNMPLIVWNALYTGKEIDASLAMNQPPLPFIQSDHTATLQALKKLSFIVSSVFHPTETTEKSLFVNLNSLEKNYESIYRDPLGTPLLKSLVLLETTFNSVSDSIDNRLARRAMCFDNMRNPQADVLKNVFLEYYAHQIQPYMAQVQRIGYEWFSTHEKMLSFLSVPEEIKKYTDQVFMTDTDISVWKRYISARNRHTEAWHRILTQCNLMPSLSD
ncbi:DUF3080 family protein [Neptunomonas antarctica]|uniref:DUF3080 domain-containing protein n=1 Tax=Neptunomonas antarctica TaxID=619304 RepID=A0A1N7KJR3_9GAMM|nr:DUF3080 family protein [Neptunomonas antarctica]SIS61861.1 Protein of unknown function [Neptunomonas antarctica]